METPPTQAPVMAISAAKDLIFGSTAGMVGKVFEYPFDTIKVRLQSQSASNPQFTGPLDCLKQSFKADGIGGLYRGISAPLVAAAAETAGLFFSYNLCQELIRSTSYSNLDSKQPLPLSALFICGASSGAFVSFILTPLELIKCKMQVQALAKSPIASSTSASSPPSSSTSTSIPNNKINGSRSASIHTIVKKPGPVALIREVLQIYGVRGLWLGQTGTFFRETGGSAAWFGAYEYVNASFRRLRGTDQTTAGERMVAGAAAGVSYNFILFPADTIKSRMQTEAVGVKGDKMKSFWSVAGDLYRRGGVRSLYRGCGITCLRSAPSSAIIFLVYETLKERL